MKLYEEHILPWVINKACTMAPVMDLRAKVVPKAYGDVLEVGMGSAVNLGLYDTAKVNKVYGLEPSEGMRKKAQKNLNKSPVEVEWLSLPGEQIPLEDKSVDTVVLTFTLCTIPDWQKALEGMRRVLKDDGILLFCEHGLAADTSVQKWQNRITPVWKKCAGGCHLNRPITEYLQKAGFKIENTEEMYMEQSPRFVGYMYVGMASKA